jgi:arginine-tRNA-protein transferase
MNLLQDRAVSDNHPCPYLPDRQARMEYFFAAGVSAAELDTLLSSGWRKFGLYFFRPRCPGCRACVPLRVPTDTFGPSKSQRRTARKAAAITVAFRALEFRPEIFDVYREHSLTRFGKQAQMEEFLQSFYQPSCPALQSEYWLDGRLVAVGILDRSENGLSSVYFVFRDCAAPYGLGTLSAMAEIAFAAGQGLGYYYLGYVIDANRHMAYKAGFRPHQRYDWEQQLWLPA